MRRTTLMISSAQHCKPNGSTTCLKIYVTKFQHPGRMTLRLLIQKSLFREWLICWERKVLHKRSKWKLLLSEFGRFEKRSWFQTNSYGVQRGTRWRKKHDHYRFAGCLGIGHYLSPGGRAEDFWGITWFLEEQKGGTLVTENPNGGITENFGRIQSGDHSNLHGKWRRGGNRESHQML